MSVTTFLRRATGSAAFAGGGKRRRGARPDHQIRPAGTGPADHRHPILAGYDGSNASRDALAYAAGMARRQDHWLVVVHVWRGTGGAFVPLTDRMRWLRAELADVDLTGLDIEMIVRHGVPARELRRVTKERDADAIVIGASRRFLHRFAGSVPAWLARQARCPAVVVP
ncbi:MAG TPA: universal stress protein [Streptosporangiaceae bacterium]|jgi:nucleotide-binding universal stress UspA family protein